LKRTSSPQNSSVAENLSATHFQTKTLAQQYSSNIDQEPLILVASGYRSLFEGASLASEIVLSRGTSFYYDLLDPTGTPSCLSLLYRFLHEHPIFN